MKSKKTRGVTLIEIVVVVAILGIAFLGIFRMFKYTYDAWWLGSSKLSLQQDAREAIYWISIDLKGTKSSTVGNVGTNSSFEIPLMISGPTTLTGWTSPVPAGVYRVNNAENVRSGFFAVKLVDIVNYYSLVASPFAFPHTGNYILSGWIFNSTNGVAGNSECRLLQTPALVDLAPPVFLNSVSNDFWEHITVTFNATQGTNFVIRLSNLQTGVTVYFDSISVSPQSFTFDNTDTADKVFEYYKAVETMSPVSFQEHWRLYFSTGTAQISSPHILREREDLTSPGNWDAEPSEPLCRNLESITISNNNQEYFEIDLHLFDPDAPTGRAGEQRFNLRTKIHPASP